MAVNRLLVTVLALMLVLTLVLTVVPGCAPKEEPAPSHETVNIQLYTGSLGGPGSGVESYKDYVCYNTMAIVEALGGVPDIAGSPCE